MSLVTTFGNRKDLVVDLSYRILARRPRPHWRAFPGVKHALWNIKGQAINVPVYELIGGMYRHQVKVYARVVW